jgi:hypothetical protein
MARPSKRQWPPTGEALREIYWGRRLSLHKIGILFDKSASSVLQEMRKQGVRTRTLSEAMTVYEKLPFSNDPNEKAYLQGLRAGDLHTARHGLSIRATVSTTHPAMLELVKDLFGKYGRVVASPKFLRKTNQFEWEVYGYLHASFEFLVKPLELADESFLSFFAGFFDAEGTISIFKQHRSTTTGLRVEVSSCNRDLLLLIAEKLRRIGYGAYLSEKPVRRKGEKVGYGPYNEDFWRLSLTRSDEALRLLRSLPLRHREKVAKKELALRCRKMPWVDVASQVRALRASIEAEVDDCVEAAKRIYLNRHRKMIETTSPVV